jgi:benzoylsuccinyl-CoA thiolase BbsB subunit
MREVSVIGAGMVRFGKYDGRPDHLAYKNHEELGVEACKVALKHAGVNHRKIEAAYAGQTATAQIQLCQRVTVTLGISGIPMYNHENACATSFAAFRQAYLDVANGVHDLVLVFGAEKMSGGRSGGGAIVLPEGAMFLQDIGLIMPAFFALLARRHMEEYGTTREQFAMVSVKNHKHSTMNPYAQYQQELTFEEVLNSRMVCDPITLLQCCPTGDGAAAVVLASAAVARQYTAKPVRVLGCTVHGGEYKASKGNFTAIASCVNAAKELYEIAGIGPADVDLCEQHDCFTPHELVTYEDLGFCGKGEGGRFIEEGLSGFGGKCVFNPSGGLQSKGHPIAATGVAQIVELIWQLRGECGARQVEGAKVGLAHNGGGIGPEFEPGLISLAMVAV